MEIKISQKELNKVITSVSKFTKNDGNMPILAGILIKVEKDKVTFSASNLETQIYMDTKDLEIVEVGEILVTARLLIDFVKKTPTNTMVNIKATENGEVLIKCGKSKIKLLYLPANEFPEIQINTTEANIKIKSNELRSFITHTTFAAATSDIKPIFKGCLIEVIDNMCTFVALDGYRMAIKSSQIEADGNVSAVVPANYLNTLLKVLENDEEEVEIGISDGQIFFRLENILIASTLIDGKFLDYKGILKTSNNVIKVKVKADEFKGCIDRASLISNVDKNNLIIIDINDKRMSIDASSEYGSVKEEAEVEANGNVKIGFNSKYISDVLKVLDSETVELDIYGPTSPCFIKKADVIDYSYMILPVRLNA